MPKKKRETAFGRDSDYQSFVALGKSLGTSGDGHRIKKQFELLLGSRIPSSQRAATVLLHTFDTDPLLLLGFIPEAIAVLENPVHDSGPRTVFRSLEYITVPEEYLGQLIDLAFQYLNRPKTAIVIQVCSMGFISQYIPDYLELKGELEASIAAIYPRGSTGFRSRAKKIAERLTLKIDT